MGRSSAAKRQAILKKPVGTKGLSKKPSASTSRTISKKPAVYVMPIIPKKGMHMLLNRATRKRPASKRTPYVRGAPDAKRRRDRLDNPFGMWQMTKPLPLRDVTRKLKKLRLLPTRINCPGCGGRLSKTTSWCNDVSEEKQRRCWNRNCSRTSVHPLHGHPLFTVGNQVPPLAMQSSVLSALLNRSKHADIHMQMGTAHATIERVAKRLREYLRPVVHGLVFFSFCYRVFFLFGRGEWMVAIGFGLVLGVLLGSFFW